MDEETVEHQTENDAEKELDKPSEETVEDADQKSEDGGNDVKQKSEESPYEQQIKEWKAKEAALQDELKAKEEIIEKKNRALQAEKKKNEKKDEDDLEATVAKAVDARLVVRDVEDAIKALTTDVKEREAIRLNYTHVINKTGDIQKDVKAAWAVTNADVLAKQREEADETIVPFLSSNAPSKTDPRKSDPVYRAAADILKGIKPAALKHLK